MSSSSYQKAINRLYLNRSNGPLLTRSERDCQFPADEKAAPKIGAASVFHIAVKRFAVMRVFS
jgi:hypothetical protein|tara:strand:- start:201 stop:389 length:189 start_codon:yes stop_codon:yes gene_type:complete